MPTLHRPYGQIHYQIHSSDFPMLLCAPGGLRSHMDIWPAPPGGPAQSWVGWTTALSEAGFTVVAMEQRNAGVAHGHQGGSRVAHHWGSGIRPSLLRRHCSVTFGLTA
jgi:hypothetical protein